MKIQDKLAGLFSREQRDGTRRECKRMRFGGFAFALGVAATSLLACGSGADVYDVEGTSDSGSTVGSVGPAVLPIFERGPKISVTRCWSRRAHRLCLKLSSVATSMRSWAWPA